MPSIFQRMMLKLLLPCSKFTLVYLDDIIIFSDNLDDHFKHINSVLSILAQANLTLNLRKCQFLCNSFHYLGHIITPAGIKPNPDKISALKNMLPPKNRKELMSFLGLVNWFRRFIPHLAEKTSVLTPLLSKSADWNWTADHQDAFCFLTHALTDDSFVRFPNFNQPFVLACDASLKQVGAVLLQQFNSVMHPVIFFSKLLDKHQQNYSVIEKECFAIVLSIKHFHVYLHSTFFVVRTDHRALVWLDRMKDTSSKLLRWSMFLQQYKFLIVYGKGEENAVADALSRLQSSDMTPVDDTPALFPSQVIIPQNLVTFRNLQQTKTSGPRHENWIGRTVQVLGSWFKNNKEHAKDVYNMQVVDFKEGPNLRADRWVVRLLKQDGTHDDDFLMNYTAMCKYLLPVTAQPVPAQMTPNTKPAQPVLHADLPTLQDFIIQQQQDPSLALWFKWCQQQQPPPPDHQHIAWFHADKDTIFLDENGLLSRYSTLSTSATTRRSCQLVVPTIYQQHVL
ncbi:MAG: ribonuclease H family protein, partial [Terriglobales bacterium]